MLKCEDVQRALSARLDGEDHGLDVTEDVIDAHLATCADCQAFYHRAAGLNRNLQFRTPTLPPDLSDVIMDGVEPQWRRQAATRALNIALSRVAAAIIGLGWFGWAVHYLVLAGQMGDDVVGYQLAVDATAMRFALGFALVFAAWQPRIVGGLAVIVGAMWMFTFGFQMRELLLGTLQATTLAQLGALAATIGVLVWSWIANAGWPVLVQIWRQLAAKPAR